MSRGATELLPVPYINDQKLRNRATMFARSMLLAVLTLTSIRIVSCGLEPGHHEPPPVRGFEVDSVRPGRLGLLQRRWIETMFNVPDNVPHPLNGSNPACLPPELAVQGVRMLTGDFYGPQIPKTCTVNLKQDLFLSIDNIPGSYIPNTSDAAQGRPTNPRSAKIFMTALLEVCKYKAFLMIDEEVVDVTSYFDTTDPALFHAPMGINYIRVYGYAVPPQSSVASFGSGNFVLFRFTKKGQHTIKFGLREDCIVDLTAKTDPFTWVYPDVSNEIVTYTNLAAFGSVLGANNGKWTFGKKLWTMNINVIE